MSMVDVGSKKVSKREAVAEGAVSLKASTILAIKRKKIPKGDVLEAARLAGILAAKKTPSLIPLCHPIAIEYVDVAFSIAKNTVNPALSMNSDSRRRKGWVRITTTVRGEAKTGFEMEALCAAAVAALTIYDMCKPLDKGIVISGIKLLKKSGGKSGTYVRK